MIEEDSPMPRGSYTFDTLPLISPEARKVVIELHLEKVKEYWPGRRRIACTLATDAEKIRQNQRWPPMRESAWCTLVVDFGARIGLVKAFDECEEIYSELLLHLEHPEPGWD